MIPGAPSFDLHPSVALIRALGQYDAFLAKRHAEMWECDPKEVLEQLSVARGKQLSENLGQLHLCGWWPTQADDLDVLAEVETGWP